MNIYDGSRAMPWSAGAVYYTLLFSVEISSYTHSLTSSCCVLCCPVSCPVLSCAVSVLAVLQVNAGALCQEFLEGAEYVVDGVSRDGVYKVGCWV